jgi:3' exoribonuclease, RNase T-like
MRDYVHIMTDTETLSTEDNAVLLSIGACHFDIDTAQILESFYVVLQTETVGDMNLHVSKDTLEFWEKQSVAAKAEVFNNPFAVDYVEGLRRYAEWIITMRAKSSKQKLCLWANDPDFDMVKLKNSMTAAGILPPWQYWEFKSCRTMELLGEKHGIDRRRDYPRGATHHHAGHDAAYQAQYVSGIWSKL